jgi:hypothetical protein
MRILQVPADFAVTSVGISASGHLHAELSDSPESTLIRKILVNQMLSIGRNAYLRQNQGPPVVQ